MTGFPASPKLILPEWYTNVMFIVSFCHLNNYMIKQQFTVPTQSIKTKHILFKGTQSIF